MIGLGRTIGVSLIAALPLSAAEVISNKYGERIYHHVALELSADAMLQGTGDLAYTFSDGGMFEVYVHPELLGIAHPGCSALTIRMPWTNGKIEQAAELIAEKRALYEQVEAVRQGRAERLTVAIELDPYFESDGGVSRLTACTVFFRHAFGGYVSNTAPIRE